MEEIDLSKILNTLWRKKVEIFIIILAFLVMGLVYTLKFVTPLYNSTATMLLVSADSNESAITTSDITLNSKLLSTYNNLIKSKTVLKEVISNLDLKMSEETLKKNINIKSISKTELIEITVKNENNILAKDIANEIAKVFKEKVKEMYNIDNIELIDEAQIEYEPSNINHKEDVVLFGIIGVIASIIYITVINLLDTTVKGTEMVEKEFGLPVLASIPIVRRAG